ncbi:hypothetical protein BDV95DRAFT_572486 [Massariosphaeria phaeospora]|uniref:Oxidoreductase n=1 Tax=Massariosphaeria phaeospora TaxID=100035 RepID=A0A7C8MEY2_9PLEO|nr:hypothetical protein BDV95DRAFT_572486 [Massariosphaeria phaeospora]
MTCSAGHDVSRYLSSQLRATQLQPDVSICIFSASFVLAPLVRTVPQSYALKYYFYHRSFSTLIRTRCLIIQFEINIPSNLHPRYITMIRSTEVDGVALIVGSGSGIGKEAAFSLAEAGARVVVFADMNENTATASSEESKKYASRHDYQTSVFKMNVEDEKAVQDMVDFVVAEYGCLDYCVNGAGVDNGTHTPLAETDIENFDRIMHINTRGNLLCVRTQAAAMWKQTPKTWTSRSGTRDIGRGVIVNIASANSFAGLPGKGSYTISKHAAMAITKMSGLDHSADGIRVNAVCPTWVRTPLLDEELRKNPEVQEIISAVCPIKRAAECEEVSDAVTFLCSPAASYVNGAALIIDAALTTTLRLF